MASEADIQLMAGMGRKRPFARRHLHSLSPCWRRADARFVTSIGSELELDPGLLQHRIGGMAGHHAVIDHDRAVTGLGPDFVIALAGSIERPSVIGEDRLQSLRIALDHSGGDVEEMLVMGDDP